MIIHVVTAPTPVAPAMELAHVAPDHPELVEGRLADRHRKRWQSGAVVAAMLAMVGAYVAGVSF